MLYKILYAQSALIRLYLYINVMLGTIRISCFPPVDKVDFDTDNQAVIFWEKLKLWVNMCEKW